MTRTSSLKSSGEEGRTPPRSSGGGGGGGGGGGMRLIVPLQGVVQGRGGLVLGSLIPCALYYFLQLYLKRNHSPSPSPPPSRSQSGELTFTAEILRTPSRSLLSGSSVAARLSSRASIIAKSGDSPCDIGNLKCLEDLYDPNSNPHGIVQLGLAENHLSLDLIRDWLDTNLKDSLMDERQGGLGISGLATYQPFDGSTELKIAVSGFMERVMRVPTSFDPSQIVLMAGATPAIETLSFCLADPGNAFLVPSPYYPGFDSDIKLRTGIELIPVPCRSTDNFTLSIPALERAYKQAKKRGVKVRAILISNPSNPVGNLMSRETLYSLLDFITEKNIHLVSDETHAGSIYGRDNQFLSIAEVLHSLEFDSSRVHIIYDLSKDLSLPGFRVGVIYSFNKNVAAAASKLARFSSISVPMQRLLLSMLADTGFIEGYIETNRERVRRMHTMFVDGLKQLGIECASSEGGFWCWADMSKFLRSYSERGEMELWERLLNEGKVNMTPGSSCHCIEPGWFRCCFTTLSEIDVPVVMEGIGRVVGSHMS